MYCRRVDRNVLVVVLLYPQQQDVSWKSILTQIPTVWEISRNFLWILHVMREAVWSFNHLKIEIGAYSVLRCGRPNHHAPTHTQNDVTPRVRAEKESSRQLVRVLSVLGYSRDLIVRKVYASTIVLHVYPPKNTQKTCMHDRRIVHVITTTVLHQPF